MAFGKRDLPQEKKNPFAKGLKPAMKDSPKDSEEDEEKKEVQDVQDDESEIKTKTPSIFEDIEKAGTIEDDESIVDVRVSYPKDTDITKGQEEYNIKKEVFASLIEKVDISKLLIIPREDAEKQISEVVENIISLRNVILGISEQKTLIREICSEILGYGPLETFLDEDEISDIMINGIKSAYVEIKGKIQPVNIKFRDDQQLLEICQRMVSKVGRRIDESSPICDARLEDGSRINVVIPPLSIDGVSLTIRKFKKEKLTLNELVSNNTISREIANLIKIIGYSRCNVLVTGGTGSGKTTLLNCISGYIAPDERVITCEDSAELQLQQDHVIRLETRPPSIEGKGEVNMKDLVKNCLRMRPERIIVGEVRGSEAFDLLQAMNTGHDGSMGTLHANNPRESLLRLEGIVISSNMNVPIRTVREMIASAIDIIIHIKRFPDGSRHITHITEVIGMEDQVILTQDLISYDMQKTNKNSPITLKYKGTGISQPHFMNKAALHGLEAETFSTLTSLEDYE